RARPEHKTGGSLGSPQTEFDHSRDAKKPEPPAAPARRSLRGLQWFIFFVADVQTGFGPFISVYLSSQAWTQVDIGFVLSVGGLVGLIGQMPGGAIVDAARSVKWAAGWALAIIGA